MHDVYWSEVSAESASNMTKGPPIPCTARHRAAQHDTGQHSTAQHGTAQASTGQHSRVFANSSNTISGCSGCSSSTVMKHII